HELLTGPALAGDEQRPRNARDALELVDHLLDLRRLADDLEAGLDGLPQAGILLVQLAVAIDGLEQTAHLPEQRADALPQPLAGDQEVARARRDRFGGPLNAAAL